MIKPLLKPVRRADGWWITNMPIGFDECGPYSTKQEAQDDIAGLQRFFHRERKLLEELATADAQRTRDQHEPVA